MASDWWAQGTPKHSHIPTCGWARALTGLPTIAVCAASAQELSKRIQEGKLEELRAEGVGRLLGDRWAAGLTSRATGAAEEALVALEAVPALCVGLPGEGVCVGVV
jgi:hypothetical protein